MGLQVHSELHYALKTYRYGARADSWVATRWMPPHHRHYRLHHLDPVRIMGMSVRVAQLSSENIC